MADNTVSLVAKMQVELNDFEKAMKKAGLIAEKGVKDVEQKFAHANPHMEGLSENLEKAFRLILASEAVRHLREVVKSLAEIGDEAERLGVTAEYLQEFNYAAKQSGVSVEEADAGMVTFAKHVSEAGNNVGNLSEYLRANGKSIRDANGNLLSTAEAFDVVANLIRNTKNPVDQLNAASALFGKQNGPAMVNMLKLGAAGVRELRDEADRTGTIISNEDVEKMKELNKELDAATFKMSGWVTILEVQVVKALNTVAEAVKAVFQQTTAATLDKQIADLQDAIEANQQSTGILPDIRQANTDAMLAEIDRLQKKKEDLLNEGPLRVEMGGDGGGPGRPTVTPAFGGGRGREPRDRTQDVLADLQNELRLVTATGDQRTHIEFEEKKIQALRRANVDAASDEGKAIIKTVDAIEAATIAQKHLLEITQDFRDVASGALSTMVDDLLAGKSAADTLNDALKNILNTIVQISERRLIESLFGESGQAGGGFLGPILSSFFGATPHQAGGPVSAGRPYLVGEHGPELMVPGTAGSIVPNTAISGRGGGDVQVIVNAPPGSQVRHRQESGGPNLQKIIVDIVSRGMGGGDFDSAMRGRFGARPLKVR